MAKKVAKKVTKEDDSKLFAFLGVFLTIIGFVIVYVAKKDSEYAMHYAKQGLVLGIAFVIAGAIGIIPILGWIIAPILWVILFILWILGIVYSLSGEMKVIPIVGKYADNFKV
jgi:uncharacterized membrane protein